MPPVAAAGGNDGYNVGDVGIDADGDRDGDRDGDGDDNVHGGGDPLPWDEPGVVAMLAAGEGTYAAYTSFAEELERSAGWVALGVGGVAANGSARGDMVR